MLKIKSKLTNPISVIALFAFISETSAAVSLPFLDNDEREIYIWFLISFPFYLLFLFFVTLNFNYRSLYAPSDFNNDNNFLKAFEDNTPQSSDELLEEVTTENGAGADIHILKLPKYLKTLCIIDTREISTESEIDVLVEKIPQLSKHSARTIIFLANEVSDILPKENIATSLKRAKKTMGTTYCIIYDLKSHNTTTLGKI